MAKLQQIASDEQFEYLCLTGISHIRWRVVFREVHACNTSWCGELMLMLLRVLWRWMLCEECLTFLVCGIHLIPPESVGTWRCDMWKECYDGYKSIHMQKSYSIQPTKMRPMMMTRSSDWWRYFASRAVFSLKLSRVSTPFPAPQYLLPFRAHFTTFFLLSSSIRFVSSGWAVPKPSVYVDVQSVESTIFIINFGHARNRNEIERFFFFLFLPHTTRS